MKNFPPWASRKVGLGAYFKLGDKKVGLCHGVNRKTSYTGSFFEPKNGKTVSIIKNPLFQPKKDDRCEYLDEKQQQKTKRIIFPTAALIQDSQVWIYYGSADTRIKYRSTNTDWLYKELNHSNNRT